MTDSSRRTVLACAGAACAAVLAGCTRYNSNSGIDTGPAASSSSAPAESGGRRGLRAAVRCRWQRTRRTGQDLRRPGRRRHDPDRQEDRHHPAAGGHVPRLHRGLHPRGMHRRQRLRRHHQLPLPRQPLQRQQRLGRQRPRRLPPGPRQHQGPGHLDPPGLGILQAYGSRPRPAKRADRSSTQSGGVRWSARWRPASVRHRTSPRAWRTCQAMMRSTDSGRPAAC